MLSYAKNSQLEINLLFGMIGWAIQVYDDAKYSWKSMWTLIEEPGDSLVLQFLMCCLFQREVDNQTITKKIVNESISFLEWIWGDFCGPVHPPCGPFRHFMGLIDALTKWSHDFLLSIGNQKFKRLLAQLIWLRTYFPNHSSEFTSYIYDEYWFA